MANRLATDPVAIPRMVKEGPGRYRIGDYAITQEQRALWRVDWHPEREKNRPHSVVVTDTFLTLRSARIHIEREIDAGA